MTSHLITPPIHPSILFVLLIFYVISLVVVPYLGLRFGKKLRGRYLATISLILWATGLAFYFGPNIPSLSSLTNFLFFLIHPAILSNITLDIGFFIGHYKKSS